MGNFAYTIHGPQSDALELPVRLSKSLSVRREPKISGNNLRILYQTPASAPDHQPSLYSINHGQTTSFLPPTPPHIEEMEDTDAEIQTSTSDATKLRSMLATPVNQISPPTPDNTPPREKPKLRPFLGAQPSMTSTRADSFKTANEEFISDAESDNSSPQLQPEITRSFPHLPHHLSNGVHRPSPLANVPFTSFDIASKNTSPIVPSVASIPSISAANVHDVRNDDHDLVLVEHAHTEAHLGLTDNPIVNSDVPQLIKSKKEGNKRGRSLRERLEESRQIPASPSVDKFASIIGWSNGVQTSTDNRRWSGNSNASTVEAYVIDSPRILKKRNTLRHVSKNDSLRSVSSPLPNSNRASTQSSSNSPHRLIHKKAKLSDQNRLSFGSNLSHSASAMSNLHSNIEVIKVAVIPERSSSLHPSTVSSRRHSLSTTGAPTSFRTPRSAENSQRLRATSDASDRGRAMHYPPQVPARGSSLSAPTSRNTSRANSITSDHTRVERKRAEKDLRTTLDKMETERLVASLKTESVGTRPSFDEINDPGDVRAHDTANSTNTIENRVDILTPGTKEWADLRPPYTLHTPFSQPSFMSASPEISEARMISLHLHNNHSVQLIEPAPLPESFAVGEVRRLNRLENLEPSNTDSPLRNPRRPPTPPFPVVHPSPQEGLQLHETSTPYDQTPSTPQRPLNRPRTDSFGKGLLRNFSLKHARNKKADQDLDSTLHPFWRPRPFWDGIEPVSPEKKANVDKGEPGIINNSLGLPQQRTIITGPLSLVRKFSDRKRGGKVIFKQSSYGSLQRISRARKVHFAPTLDMRLHLTTWRDLQGKFTSARLKREEDKREKRREVLRRSIGPNVVATGDSRFLSSEMSNSRAWA